MAEIKDSQLIRDALGSPVPQYWDETSQMYIARTVDGSFADVDFSKVRLLRDKLGSPIPQLWDIETAKFVPGKGGSNGEVTIESVPGLRSELDQTNATLAEKANYRQTNGGATGQELSVNMIAGHGENAIAPGLFAGLIAGGGQSGYNNVIGGFPATVGTPTKNEVDPSITGANYVALGGGYDNVVNGLASAVTGYHCVVEKESTHGTISGGSYHKITAGDYGTIGGGTANLLHGTRATISGGQNNVVSTTAPGSVISGGSSNQATGDHATVLGGMNNVCSGALAAVFGGRDNLASGQYSAAIGRDAKATNNGQVASANGKFSVQGDAQTSDIVMRRQTTTATATLIGLSGAAASPQFSANQSIGFKYTVVARATNGDTKMIEVKGLWAKTGTAASQIIGTPIKTIVAESAGAVTWDVSVFTGSSSLQINAIGEAAKTINWVAKLELVEVIA